MKHALTLTALLATVVLCSFPASGTEIEPLSVSPGAIDRVTGVEVRCPTFSWQAVSGAVGYEVVVYELPPRVNLAGWNLDEAVEVLFVELPVGVTAWTPSFESGLERGADHVWFVRGVYGEDEAAVWSQARFFRVVGTLAQAESGLVNRGRSGDSGTGSGTGSGSMGARSGVTEAGAGGSAMADRLGETKAKDVSTAIAAIRGEMPDAAGETYGVVGVSNSLEGAGLGAVNTAGGPDLVLDGAEDGETDTKISQGGVDRASAGSEAFRFTNSGAGVISLWIEGLLSADTLVGDGSGVTSVDAALLDGHPPEHYAMTDELASPDGPSVHWDNLDTIPPGLDDGDNDTTYTAGFGLSLDGTTFNSRGSGWAGMVIVAQHGGDFTSIQQAIDAIPGGNPLNRWLVWISPGTYAETVLLKPYVHLQGAGPGATVITSDEGAAAFPPSGTVTLTSFSSLRDLTIENTGSHMFNAAIKIDVGTIESYVENVIAWASGGGESNNAVVIGGGATAEITLRNVTAHAEGASTNNIGLYNRLGATVVLVGGSYSGQGGISCAGVLNYGGGTQLQSMGASITGRYGSGSNYGLRNEGSVARLQMTKVETEGPGSQGLYNSDGGVLEAESTVVAVYNSAGTDGFGFSNGAGSSAELRGGSISSFGGGVACGIRNLGSGTELEASDVMVLGTLGINDNIGLYNGSGSRATLSGGSFEGHGGMSGSGITNSGVDSRLVAVATAAHGDGGSVENHGLLNEDGAFVELFGGDYSGNGGDYAWGILNSDSDTVLGAVGVRALGESATYNRGVETKDSAGAVLHGGELIGRGGDAAYGIHYYNGSFLDATNVLARGEGASKGNQGMVQWGDTVRIGSSQLVGGVYRVDGTLICTQVIDGNFSSYTCP